MKVSDFGAVLATSRARVVVPLPRVYGGGGGGGACVSLRCCVMILAVSG